MTQSSTENFFDNLGGGGGAPSAKLSALDDFVVGEIVDQFMIVATDFSTKKPKVDKNGKEIEQLAVVLQTEQRNWAGVSKIPLVDKDDKSSGEKPASEDDGRRVVYIEPWTNLAYVVRDHLRDSGIQGGLKTGGTLGVKIIGFKDTNKGNPAKQHAVKYTPPAAKAASDAFFGDQGATQSAPAAEAAPAQEAPAAPAAEAPKDPWGTPQPGGSKAPF